MMTLSLLDLYAVLFDVLDAELRQDNLEDAVLHRSRTFLPLDAVDGEGALEASRAALAHQILQMVLFFILYKFYLNIS